MAFLELKNLSKSFGGVSVLKDVNLCIEKGEFVAIVGFSGSGKTTLINMITGLLRRGVIPKTKDGIEPLAAIYPKSALGKLRLELQQGRAPAANWFAKQCVAVGVAQFVDVSSDDAECFASANSPEAFQRLTRIGLTSSSRTSAQA